jgi:long-chain fatty acid transport protein
MTDIVYPYQWDDVMRVSVGIEGQPSDIIKLRGGYSFDQSPVPDDVASPLVTDTGDRHHLTGGISAFYKNLEFAATGGVAIMPDRNVSQLTDLNNDGIWDNLTGKYGNSSFNTSFSMTVKF